MGSYIFLPIFRKTAAKVSAQELEDTFATKHEVLQEHIFYCRGQDLPEACEGKSCDEAAKRCNALLCPEASVAMQGQEQ